MSEQILTTEIFNSLNLDGGWMLKSVSILKWGTEMVIDASLD